MSWQLSVFTLLALVLVVGGVWFERSRPSARVVAAVAALAALGVAGRLVLAPIPNVVATTDVALITGYVLGGPPGFAVGALSALISNFWLGQGPWTPWQMAGWGMVGVGGAVLATLTARRFGRWGLAIAGAVAGLAYGAFLDLSAMVSFGGEQSLDRYLALSIRGIPFNIAHAVGNAAIMLAAGPALVRIVDRYRDRFEVEWEPVPAGGRIPSGAAGGGLAALLICAGLALGLSGVGAERAAAEPSAQASGSGPVGWLRQAQNDDGGFGISPGASSSPGMTGWAMLGLESAGVNPRDVRSGGRTAVEYLRRHVDDVGSTGDLERTILALRGAGIGVRNFGRRDLLAELRSRQRGNGSYDKQVNQTAFAILARVAAGEETGSLRKPAGWLREAQNKNGGWGSVPSGPSEPDSTGAALQALALVGAEKPIGEGVRWLKRAQNGDGGWALVQGSGSNAQSTAWALQGLVAVGANPRISKRSRTGFDYLSSRRQSDGHYRYSKSSDQTPVWVTAQALAGVEREAFPIAPVGLKPDEGDGNGTGDGGDGSSGGYGSGSGYQPSSGGQLDGLDDLGELGDPGGLGGDYKRALEESLGSGAGKKESREGGDGEAQAGTGPGPEAEAEVLPEAAVIVPPEEEEEAPIGESEVPATPVLLGGIGVLALGLAGGWLLYRRTLP